MKEIQGFGILWRVCGTVMLGVVLGLSGVHVDDFSLILILVVVVALLMGLMWSDAK